MRRGAKVAEPVVAELVVVLVVPVVLPVSSSSPHPAPIIIVAPSSSALAKMLIEAFMYCSLLGLFPPKESRGTATRRSPLHTATATQFTPKIARMCARKPRERVHLQWFGVGSMVIPLLWMIGHHTGLRKLFVSLHHRCMCAGHREHAPVKHIRRCALERM